MVTSSERADLVALVCDGCLIAFLSLSHVVSWVRCGAGLYRYLIFVTFLTEECGSEWFLGYEGFKILLGVDMSLGQHISCKTLCEYIIIKKNQHIPFSEKKSK